MRCEEIPILSRETKRNPLSPFPEDRKFITLTSSKGDGMKSHDLYNLVLDISEEKCDSAVAMLKILLESR